MHLNKITKKNQALTQGMHDICFVVGNGPSLTAEDLKKAKSYPVFTVNYFHRGFPDLESDITYALILAGSENMCAREYILDTYERCRHTKFIFIYR